MQACQVGLGLCVKRHEWLDKWDWKANLASNTIALETLCLCRQGSKMIFQHHSIRGIVLWVLQIEHNDLVFNNEKWHMVKIQLGSST
jgi:hypothetical protein